MNESTQSTRNIGIGIAFGLAIGVGFAVILGNFVFIGAGLPMGIAIGMAMNQDKEASTESRPLLIWALVLGVLVLTVTTAIYFYLR